MAWAATIKQKGIVDKAFLVNILYDNGSIQFNEVVDMTGGTLQGLSDRISSRLATLESTQTLIPQVVTGAFIPLPTTPNSQTAFQAAMHHFQSCQRAVSLGLITTTDAVYTTAQANMISLYDPAFIDVV